MVSTIRSLEFFVLFQVSYLRFVYMSLSLLKSLNYYLKSVFFLLTGHAFLNLLNILIIHYNLSGS